jgi:hypothetical protein
MEIILDDALCKLHGLVGLELVMLEVGHTAFMAFATAGLRGVRGSAIVALF